MTDDQVNTEEMAENRKRREAGATATEAGEANVPERNPSAIDPAVNLLPKHWGTRIWTRLGAWGIRTHVRHPRPQ